MRPLWITLEPHPWLGYEWDQPRRHPGSLSITLVGPRGAGGGVGRCPAWARGSLGWASWGSTWPGRRSGPGSLWLPRCRWCRNWSRPGMLSRPEREGKSLSPTAKERGGERARAIKPVRGDRDPPWLRHVVDIYNGKNRGHDVVGLRL